MGHTEDDWNDAQVAEEQRQVALADILARLTVPRGTRQFFAFTCENEDLGWRLVYIGKANEDRADVLREAEARLTQTEGQVRDMYYDSLMKNLRCWSYTTVRRKHQLRAAVYLGLMRLRAPTSALTPWDW